LALAAWLKPCPDTSCLPGRFLAGIEARAIRQAASGGMSEAMPFQNGEWAGAALKATGPRSGVCPTAGGAGG